MRRRRSPSIVSRSSVTVQRYCRYLGDASMTPSAGDRPWLLLPSFAVSGCPRPTLDRRTIGEEPVREVVTMTSAEALTPWPSDDHVPIEELARRQGVEPVESLDDLACPELWDSDEEYERFLADLYESRQSSLA